MKSKDSHDRVDGDDDRHDDDDDEAGRRRGRREGGGGTTATAASALPLHISPPPPPPAAATAASAPASGLEPLDLSLSPSPSTSLPIPLLQPSSSSPSSSLSPSASASSLTLPPRASPSPTPSSASPSLSPSSASPSPSASSCQLTKKQTGALQQIRERLQDVLQPHHDDHCLLRWLRARNFNVDKSEAMFRKDLMWRSEIGADTIVEDYEDPMVIKNYYTGGVCGVDKTGCPILWDPSGNLDMEGLLKSVKKSCLMKNKVKCMEELCRLFRTASQQERGINQIVSIMDVKNLGQKHLWKPGVKVFSELISMFEAHYPEILKQCFVINAAAIFSILFNIVKPLLSSATQSKIHVLGGNYLPTLLQYIEADQIPVFYGGTLRDSTGDPKCSLQICYGGDVPPDLYYHRNMLEGATKPEEVHIGARSYSEIPIEVTQPGSLLSWQFTTVDCDIRFEVHRMCQSGGADPRDEECDSVVVVPEQQVESHFVPEVTDIVCSEPGTYVFRFDNTHSWIRSKHVLYQINVQSPPSSADVTGH
ncbi:SEC14-like protein 2 [Argonauta hians]